MLSSRQAAYGTPSRQAASGTFSRAPAYPPAGPPIAAPAESPRGHPVNMLSGKRGEYSRYREEVLPMLEQQETPAYDSAGRRWVKCETCGRIAVEDEFKSYGGPRHANLGICYDCRRKA